jgi:acetylornithine aminotransferase
MTSALSNTYSRLPVAFTHGKGVWLWDTKGRRYLDAMAGIGVSCLGHAHPKLVAAISEQAARVIHVSNLYEVPEQEELAQRMTKMSGMTEIVFGNSGAEANEAAIKLARKFGHNKGIEKPEIVVYEKAFHGRSIATLSATGNTKIQEGFGPLVEGFLRVPVNDIASLKQATENNSNVVAVANHFFDSSRSHQWRFT